MDDLGTMCVTFSANLDALNAGAQQAQQQMSNVEQAANNASSNAGSGFMGAAQGVMQFATQTYAAVLSLKGYYDMITNGVGAMLSSAATAEQTGVAYTTLMHSASGASAELSKLNTFAATTPFQTQAIDDAGSKLLAFGFKAQDIIPAVTAIGDSLSALGKGTPAALNSIVDIFGKIDAAGKLTGGDMMQMSAWGIPAWNMLSEVMHKPVTELQAMVSKGMVPAKTAIADLEAGMEKTFGGGMAKQANTLNGLISTFQSNVTLAWNALLGVQGGQVQKGSLFGIVEQGLNNVGTVLASSSFQGLAASWGANISAALAQVGSAVQPVISLVGMLADSWSGFLGSIDVGGITSAFSGVVAAAQNLGATVGPLLGFALNNINNLAEQLAHEFSGLVAPALSLIQQYIQGMTPVWQNLVFAVSDLTDIAGTLAEIISPVVIDFANWLANSGILSTALGGLAAISGTLESGLLNLEVGLRSVAQFFEQNQVAGDILRDSLIGIGVAIAAIQIGSFIATIPALVAGFITWAGAAWAAAIATIAATWPIIAIGAAIAIVVAGIVLAVQHWGEIAHWLQGVWGAFSGWFMGMIGAIGHWFQSAWGGMGKWFQDLWGGIVNDAKKGLGMLVDSITAPFKAIGGWFEWLYNHNYYFKDLVDSIVTVMTRCVSWLEGAWNGVATFVTGIWNRIWANTVQGWQTISGIFSSAWSTYIAGPIGGLWNSFIAWVVGLWNQIWKNTEQGWQTISTIFGGAWNTYIAGPLGGIWTSISGWFGNLASSAMVCFCSHKVDPLCA